MKFAANISMMFNELDFLDRMEASAKEGFSGVEFLFPYQYPKENIQQHIQKHHLEIALFNLHPGDWQQGERGIGCHPDRHEEFYKSVELGVEYATKLNCKNLHLMAGLKPKNISHEKMEETFLAHIRYAAKACEKYGIDILLEPINGRNMPDYFLNNFEYAVSLIDRINLPNVKLQFDFYHCQIIHGDLASNIKKYFDYVGHIQIAGVPERNEPDIGEINYAYIFDVLKSLNYNAWIGCEYSPKSKTEDGLAWYKNFKDKK